MVSIRMLWWYIMMSCIMTICISTYSLLSLINSIILQRVYFKAMREYRAQGYCVPTCPHKSRHRTLNYFSFVVTKPCTIRYSSVFVQLKFPHIMIFIIQHLWFLFIWCLCFPNLLFLLVEVLVFFCFFYCHLN